MPASRMSQAHNHADPASDVKRVLWATLFLNLLVASAKFTWGYLTGSISMEADGIHSFLDATSNIVALIGIWVAYHPPDETHPYGHRKFETFASFCISVFLFLGCFNILRESYFRFQDSSTVRVPISSFVIMIATMIINYGVMTWESRRGKDLHSDLLTADAMHTRSDIFSSLSVLISLGAARIGYPILDPVIAIVIAGIVGKTGFEILLESSKVLTDYSRIGSDEIRNVVMRIEGIEECHAVRTRGSANHIYVDLHIHVPPTVHLEKAHRMAHQVEAEIKKTFPDVVEVVVHVEPHLPNLEND